MVRTKNEMENLSSGIGEIRDEWWHDDTRETYVSLAIELANYTDWDTDTIIRFLGTAFGAAANEYGG